MWEQPPVIGYKVILNPEGEHYQEYRHQSKDGAGWIIKNNITEYDLKNWSRQPEHERLRALVRVKWENKGVGNYRLSDLLPIENGFRDVTHVFFNDGLVLRDFTEELEELIDEKVIVDEKAIIRRLDYNQAYRDHFLNQDESTEGRDGEELPL